MDLGIKNALGSDKLIGDSQLCRLRFDGIAEEVQGIA